MAADLQISHLSKSYPCASNPQGQKIIDNISLNVPKGSITTILGGNGCGKSTLLRIITGIEEPDSGEILISGQKKDRLGRIGMVSQELNLFPWRTALENVAFGLEMQKMPKQKRLDLAKACLAAFGLGNYANHFPLELSGGMRQKVAIARSLVTAPDILLMDEPFSALDFQTRTGLQCFLLQLWGKLRETILFVTHEVEEAVFLSDQIVLVSAIPARIKKIIKVNLPHPRRRSSPEFMQIASEVMEEYGSGSGLGAAELEQALTVLGQRQASCR